MMERTIRVLVVDDSALMRQMVSRFLTEAGMEVVGTANNGEQGLEAALELKPDVIVLDVEMPRMDGLEMLRRLMRIEPMRVVMLSSLTQKHAPATVEALSLGAVEAVGKPSGGISLDLHRVRDELVHKVTVAAQARLQKQGTAPNRARLRSHAAAPKASRYRMLVIGASTGGPGALAHVLETLPGDFPVPIVVVQHMPAGFTLSLANRLDNLSALSVNEAREGVKAQPGEVWIAPGGVHLVFERNGAMRFNLDPPHLGVRPAVDVTVESAVARWGGSVLLAVLTGMGMDGAKGARLVKQAGGKVLAQDESSCVVYGMPRAVVEMGSADVVCPLDEIPQALLTVVRGR